MNIHPIAQSKRLAEKNKLAAKNKTKTLICKKYLAIARFVFDTIVSPLSWRQAPNGWRYPRVGGTR